MTGHACGQIVVAHVVLNAWNAPGWRPVVVQSSCEPSVQVPSRWQQAPSQMPDVAQSVPEPRKVPVHTSGATSVQLPSLWQQAPRLPPIGTPTAVMIACSVEKPTAPKVT